MLITPKKPWFIIWLIIFSIILLMAIILSLVVNNDFNDLRVKNNLLVILAGIIILVIGFLGYKKTPIISDELQKTIQIQIFSFTYISFLGFLAFFSLLQLVCRFKLEPQEVISIIFSGTLLIQLIISFFVKRKYK